MPIPEYLNQPFGGATVYEYAFCILVILISIIAIKYISRLFAKLTYTFFVKFSSGNHYKDFFLLLLHPIEGVLLTIIIYLTINNRLGEVFDSVVIIKRDVSSNNSSYIFHHSITLATVLDHLFFLFFIFYFSLFISRIVDFVFYVLLKRAFHNNDKERQQLLPLLKDVIKILLWSIALLFVLGIVFHVNIPTLIAGLGVGGIAIAFAAKETLENLLASFMVMIDKPFTIGDWVKVDGAEGIIEKVGFRSTRIRTFDKSLIVLPNRALIDGQLENHSDRGMRREKLSIGVIYGLSQATLETMITEIENFIINTPNTTEQPIVFLDTFGDSSVNIAVSYYIIVSTDTNYFKIKETVNFGIYRIVYQYGGGFAFPTQAHLDLGNTNDVETYKE